MGRRQHKPEHTCIGQPIEQLECRRMLSGGPLDPTFGVNGEGQDDFNGQITSSALLPNGVLVNVGYSSLKTFFPHAYSFTPQISAVTNTGKAVSVSLSSTATADLFQIVDIQLTKVVALPDGKLLIFGQNPYSNGLCSEVYSLSLNAKGTAAILKPAGPELGGTNWSFLAIQPDQKMLIYSDGVIYRKDAHGYVDSTFKPVAVDFTPTAAVVESNGKLLFAGPGASIGTNSAIELLQLNSNGSHDASFRADGIERAAIGFASVDQLLIAENGEIYVAGKDSAYGRLIAGFKPTGQFDYSFANNGLLHSPSNVGGFTMAEGGGRLIVAGIINDHPNDISAVWRYTLAGQPDTGFNDGQPIEIYGDIAQQIFREVNGRILVTGADVIIRILQTPPVTTQPISL